MHYRDCIKASAWVPVQIWLQISNQLTSYLRFKNFSLPPFVGPQNSGPGCCSNPNSPPECGTVHYEVMNDDCRSGWSKYKLVFIYFTENVIISINITNCLSHTPCACHFDGHHSPDDRSALPHLWLELSATCCVKLRLSLSTFISTLKTHMFYTAFC